MTHEVPIQRLARSDVLLCLPLRWVMAFVATVATLTVAVTLAACFDRLLFVWLHQHGFAWVLAGGGLLLGVFVHWFLGRRKASFVERGFRYVVHRDKTRSEIHIEGAGGDSLLAMLDGLAVILPLVLSALPAGHPVLLATPWFDDRRPRAQRRLARRLAVAVPAATLAEYQGALPLPEHLIVCAWRAYNAVAKLIGRRADRSHFSAFAAIHPNAWLKTPLSGFIVSTGSPRRD